MFYFFALTGIILSISFFFTPDICTANCNTALLNRLLPYGGVLYFCVAVFLYRCNIPALGWILPLGLGFHVGLFISGVLAKTWCPVCLVILATNFCMLMDYVLLKKSIKAGQVIGIIGALVLTLYVGNAVFVESNINNKSKSHEVADNTVAQSETQQPFVINVHDYTGDTVQLDLKQSPVLLWYPYCDPCKEDIPRVKDGVPLLAVWVNDPEEIKAARDFAAKYNKEIFYTDKLDITIEAVPSMLYWDQEESKIKTSYDIPTK